MPKTFNPVPVITGQTINCPHCGDDCGLHHDRVRVWNRVEDAEQGMYADVLEDSVLLGTKVGENSGNPSRRRSGLIIDFWCEICGKNSSLTIAQHKGVTLVEWVPRKKSNRRAHE